MTATKHHAQLVILKFLFESCGFGQSILPEREKVDEFGSEEAEFSVAPHNIDRPVPRDSHKPCRGIVGNSMNRPGFQSPAQRVLDDVLGEVKACQSKDSR